EINTLPGLTTESLVPKSAWVIGISFEKLLDVLIEEALGTRPRQKEKAHPRETASRLTRGARH
ncbi:hypothetical protein HY478_01155, partial [Candidatus Uhrbacteria bacterium]|nr:hypothetical protein [Candidatus Uhrbacteria bacterium]